MRTRGLAVCGLLLACAAAPRLAARGEFQGLRFDSSADSEAARCLVAGDCDPALRARIARAAAGLSPGAPEREGLRRVAEELSLDAAALVFAERVLADPENRRLQDAFDREIARVKAGEPGDAAPLPAVFAPGWFYRLNPQNRGDFRHVRARFEPEGIPTRLIEFDENGAVEANAAAIADYVRAHPAGDFILVSSSKSGPEAAYALGALLSPEEARPVRAWINIGGVLRGSPLADAALAPPKRWLLAFDLWRRDLAFDGVESLGTARSLARMARVRFPPELLVLNVVGVPLSGDLTERGREAYEAVSAYGPNDGQTLLADVLAPGGAAILLPGADHYFALPDIADRALAAHRVVSAEVRARDRNRSGARGPEAGALR